MSIKFQAFAALGFLFSTVCYNLSAQEKNLVQNAGFEKYEKCPVDYTPENLSHKLIPE